MNIEELVRYLKEILMTGRKEHIPLEIDGALLFGSWSQESQDISSDVDLLVVAENINPKRHRRGTEIALIKRYFQELSLDILLLTKKEVISNFLNHNPLLLDIAEDGIIILDDNHFLQNQILETRDYIREKGIKRFEDGWVFPVVKGAPAYLSKVSNQDFSQAMIKDGERDFEIGQRLIEAGYYDKAVYHFQQSTEKSIKSILIAMGIFQKTHLIGRVLRKVTAERDIPIKWKDKLIEVAEISESIEPEVSLSRYPGIIDDSLWLPFEEYSKEDADGAMAKAERSLSIAKEFIKDWFSQVP